jgi:formylglycine-generating enzyme required for sulfatase activity/predicted Ser/Thr protein kinase
MSKNSIDSQSLPPGTHLHEFVIERVLGSGGFGITYLARDTSLNRYVVIKENLPSQFAWRETSTGTVRPRHETGSDVDDYDWSLSNFLREADMLASLDHPGIVRVLRKFEGNGTAYFVMPFVDGVTFDQLIEEHKGKGLPFDEAGLQGLLERVLDALDHLHQRGIYHRDIKPGNILITNEGLPVLIDFGSARQRMSERSMTVVESPGYTPFEQLQSRGNVGPWSDLYALGGTLEKALTGEAPPKAMDRMRNDPRLPLVDRHDLINKYSKNFLRCIDKALEVEEVIRWQRASEWLNGMHESASVEDSVLNPYSSKPKSDITFDDKEKLIQVAALIIFVLFIIYLFVVVIKGESETGKKYYQYTNTDSTEISNNLAQSHVIETEARAKELEERAIEAEKLRHEIEQKNQADEQAKQLEENQKLEKQRNQQARGEYAGEEMDIEIAPGVALTMCWCPPGDFIMGSPFTEEGRYNDENQVRVTISKGFWIGKTEVTQTQWQAVMGSDSSQFILGNQPVESVSWYDAQDFIKKLNLSFTNSNWKIALPTEAQWEYAARAGQNFTYAGGDSISQLAWYNENSNAKTNPVGYKKANTWGLHDMSGNVAEWCQDLYDDKLLGGADPTGAVSGNFRVCRGGSWIRDAISSRVAIRRYDVPTNAHSHVGFRIVRNSVSRPAGS